MGDSNGENGMLSEFSQAEIKLGQVLLGLIGGSIGVATIFGIAALIAGNVSQASNYAAFVSGLSTMLLVLVTIWYASQVRKQTREMDRQALVMQESEWNPEVFFNATAEQFFTRGKRAWFPEFKAEANGEESEWVDNDFIPVEGDSDDLGVEWITSIPEDIGNFLSSFESGEHTGNLYFKYESFTGEEYWLIYTIEFRAFDDGYELIRYPNMERKLPWENL